MRWLVALALLLTSHAAAAGPPPSASASPPATEAQSAKAAPRVGPSRRALATSAGMLVPGVLAHGSGHFVLGEPETARRLLLMEATGLALFLTGGVTIVLTGASRYFVAPSATLTIGGFG